MDAHLQPALDMLRRAYSHPPSHVEYYALMHALYERFSQRNLAQLMTEFTGKDYGTVLNEVYGVEGRSRSISEADLRAVWNALDAVRFRDWLKESE